LWVPSCVDVQGFHLKHSELPQSWLEDDVLAFDRGAIGVCPLRRNLPENVLQIIDLLCVIDWIVVKHNPLIFIF